MLWLDVKYIRLLSHRLEKFKQRGNNNFNFRCPLCGDSQKNKTKSRGYLYERKGAFWFHCHNGCGGLTFQKFLRTIDLSLYNDYVAESLTERNKTEEYEHVVPIRPTQSHEEDVFKDLQKISQLSPFHVAVSYVRGRKIPEQFYETMYYAPHFKTFVNSLIPDKFSSSKHDNGRLILPFRQRDGKVFGFQGRALDPNDQLRYIAIMLNENEDHLFGLERMDFNKRFYVVEGPIDSFFLDNCIAAGGGELALSVQRAGLDMRKGVLVGDNEPRNKEIVSKARKAIVRGFQVCIWPSYVVQKDINEMILEGGYTASEVQHIIDVNTFQGLEAELAFANWSKV